jgi:hypothetical protein
VQNHRQIVTLRQPQLRLQHDLLALKLRIVTIQIEPRLPHGDQLSVALAQALFQQLKTALIMPFDRNGMQSHGGINRFMLLRQR